METSKIDAQDIRNKQAEIEELTKVTAMKNQEYYFLKEVISREHEKLKELQDEFLYRRELSHKIKSEIENFGDQASLESFNNIKEIRKKVIRKIINSELCSRVSQLNRLDKGVPSDPKDSNYYQLVFDSVKFISENSSLSFRIMRSTTFLDIKLHLCEIYKIEDHKEFIIADYLDALIINEDQSIDEYLKHYSVFLNVFNFVPRETFMKRLKLSLIQEDRLKENLMSKSRNQGESNKRKGQEINQDYDVVQKKINDLNIQFPLLKIFQKDEKAAKLLPQKFTILEKAKNIETSFIMCIILVFLYCFTLVSIFNRTSLHYQYLKKRELASFYDNSKIKNYTELHNYFTTVVGFPLLSKNDSLYEKEIHKLQNSEDVKVYDYYYSKYNLSDFAYTGFLKVSPIKFIVYSANSKSCNTGVSAKLTDCYESFVEIPTNKLVTLTSKKDELLFYFNPVKDAKSPYYYEDSIVGPLQSQGTLFEIPLDSDYRLYAIDLMKAIPINPNFQSSATVEDFNPDLISQDIEDYAFVHSSVRAIQVFFTVFSNSENVYYNVKVVFNLLPTGIIIPGNFEVDNVKFDIYSANIKNQISEAIRFICVFILFGLMIFNLINIILTSQEGMLFTNFINKMSQTTLWLILVYMIIFFLKVTRLRDGSPLDDNLLLTSDPNICSENQANSLYLECLYLLIISIKLLYFMNLNETVSLYFNSVFDYIFRSILYLLFCVLTFLIFSSINYIILGSINQNSSTYTLSYVKILTLPIGGLDWSSFLKFDTFWGVIFSLTFYAFLSFYMMAILISLFNESLREKVSLEGYPSDNAQVDWTTYDYLRWLFFCLKSDASRTLDQN